MNMATTVLIWVVVICGLVPSFGFLFTHRPTRPWRTQAKLVTALVMVPTLLYVRAGLVLVTHGGVPSLTGTLDRIISIGLGLLCDWLFISLWMNFRRYRAAWDEEEQQHAAEVKR